MQNLVLGGGGEKVEGQTRYIRGQCNGREQTADIFL